MGGTRFSDVSMFRRCAVAIDISDRRRGQPGVGQRLLHGDAHGGGFRPSNVGAIGIAAEADQFRVDARTLARACDSASSTSMPAPSPTTRPSRALS